jgi:hypothetical protein
MFVVVVKFKFEFQFKVFYVGIYDIDCLILIYSNVSDLFDNFSTFI